MVNEAAALVEAMPVRPSQQDDRGNLYLAFPAICLVIAIGGFVPTFWIPLASGGNAGSPMVVLHGFVFTAWPVLLLWQAWQVEHGRLSRHRAFGVAGVSLATAMLLIGIATAILSYQARTTAGLEPAARRQLIVPISNIALFFAFFAAAVACLARSDWHKRLMLIATVQTLIAPLARWFFVLLGERQIGASAAVSPPARPIQALRPTTIIIVLLVGAMLYDRKRRGFLHPAWPIGIAATLAVAVLRVPLSETEAWAGMVRWLAAFL